jgi:hypothetical protein
MAAAAVVVVVVVIRLEEEALLAETCAAAAQVELAPACADSRERCVCVCACVRACVRACAASSSQPPFACNDESAEPANIQTGNHDYRRRAVSK